LIPASPPVPAKPVPPPRGADGRWRMASPTTHQHRAVGARECGAGERTPNPSGEWIASGSHSGKVAVQILAQSYRKGVARKPEGERQPGFLEAVCNQIRCDPRKRGNPNLLTAADACSAHRTPSDRQCASPMSVSEAAWGASEGTCRGLLRPG
jgi:hypothetical protein